METKKQIKVSEVVLIDDLYPRAKVNPFTVQRYKEVIRSGGKLPPIEVAIRNGVPALIDGNHRLEAHKAEKITTIDAVIYTDLTDKEIFIKAVEANAKHGAPLSSEDLVKTMLRLKILGLNKIEIGKIVSIRADRIEKFVNDRTMTIRNAVSGIAQKLYLKRVVRDKYKTDSDVEGDGSRGEFKEDAPNTIQEMPDDSHLTSLNQLSLVNNLITIIENKLLNKKNKLLMEQIETLKKLLNKL